MGNGEEEESAGGKKGVSPHDKQRPIRAADIFQSHYIADIDNLPTIAKRRVNALKNLQVKYAQIEAKFYEEVCDLERKYAVLYQPLVDKQFEIINAIYEPTEEECEWKPDEEEEISEELKEKAKIEDEKKDEKKEDPKGIPEFWLTVFKNVELLSDMVQKHDELILKHLKDIKVEFSDAGQPRKTPESGDLDDAAEAILAADFEIGHFLHEHVIPRLMLYFTGEVVENDDNDYDEESEGVDEEGEEEGDEENDPDYNPKEGAKPSRVQATVKQDAHREGQNLNVTFHHPESEAFPSHETDGCCKVEQELVS
ncbi:Nucleosome assembly protein 1-like 1 [Fukomys damarensis]|uniref:Nucleosome assembly protein 1-like 1 n=1 Tax=Fukomys damarensis TaxID=885580 RepID=A0A091DMS4_FUKDA|nr:Nucleosome assembly protein 1-like 1 [Fukomys damarensis]